MGKPKPATAVVQVGQAPTCSTCLYLDMRLGRGDSVRVVKGQKVQFVCTRARDPLTGKPGELCSVERQVGLCGPRGMLWEESGNVGEEQPQLYAGQPETVLGIGPGPDEDALFGPADGLGDDL